MFYFLFHQQHLRSVFPASRHLKFWLFPLTGCFGHRMTASLSQVFPKQKKPFLFQRKDVVVPALLTDTGERKQTLGCNSKSTCSVNPFLSHYMCFFSIPDAAPGSLPRFICANPEKNRGCCFNRLNRPLSARSLFRPEESADPAKMYRMRYW